MKNLLMLSTLTLSLMFSAGSSAEWTQVSESVGGVKTYVDFDRIRKVKGLVYYWDLRDLLEPSSAGDLSHKIYTKADCDTMRSMKLSFSAYNLPMAEGAANITFTPDPNWDYAQPDSVLEGTLQAVCAH
tara:strand:- start:579 stop:965 length:387 start_codon:yes stop_codon:yes gene_type:complete